MKKTTCICILAVLVSFIACAGENSARKKNEINMLFIGNSFTQRHHLKDLVKKVFEEGNPGLTVNAEIRVYGGQNLLKHSSYYCSQTFIEQSTISNEEIQARIDQMETLLTLETNPPEWDEFYTVVKHKGSNIPPFTQTHSIIKRAIKAHEKLLKNNPRTKWDYVVLQSWQDVDPSLNQGYAKYARKFAEVARQQGAEVILYTTAPNMQNPKPVEEPRFQERVDRELKLAKELEKEINAYAVVPVPLAINRIQKGGTDLTFCYMNDFHPNQRTAFLTSNMFYAAVFKKSPVGFEYNSVTETLPKGMGEGKDPDGGDATVVFENPEKEYLQKMAYEAVMAFDKGEF